MSSDNHETLVYRLAQILIKLNQGEKLNPAQLADEFKVNLRTIQRDLRLRFAYLNLQKTNGLYHLDPTELGKLSTRDIERFAALAGVRGLFPSLSDEFLRDIFDARLQSTLLIKGHSYEDLAGKSSVFRELERAIISRRRVCFDYAKPEGEKHYPDLAPYKLINHHGIWYLAAQDGDKVKSFSFAKISRLRTLDLEFDWDERIEKTLIENDGIAFSGGKQQIVIKVDREVAGYFKRRRLIANQELIKELDDGGLILSARVSHADQVLSIVRYWIPHLHIISPEPLQAELERGLADYLKRHSDRIQAD